MNKKPSLNPIDHNTMKYEITNEAHPDNPNLRRIKALRDFGDVKKGDLGGYIESEKNLSQEGNCWVSGTAWVYGNARVYEDAWVYGDASVYGNAEVYGVAKVSGDAKVFGFAKVYGGAVLSWNAVVSGDTEEPVSQFPNEITIGGVVYVKKA